MHVLSTPDFSKFRHAVRNVQCRSCKENSSLFSSAFSKASPGSLPSLHSVLGSGSSKMLVLYETSLGYCLFKLTDDAKLESKDVWKDFETPEKANKL